MSEVKPEEFERKRALCDFEMVWAKLSKMHFPSLKESYEYAYLAGRGARRTTESVKTLTDALVDKR